MSNRNAKQVFFCFPKANMYLSLIDLYCIYEKYTP